MEAPPQQLTSSSQKADMKKLKEDYEGLEKAHK
jgi:hypothetical protein